jgi:hypothetical protein
MTLKEYISELTYCTKRYPLAFQDTIIRCPQSERDFRIEDLKEDSPIWDLLVQRATQSETGVVYAKRGKAPVKPKLLIELTNSPDGYLGACFIDEPYRSLEQSVGGYWFSYQEFTE